MPKVPQLEQQVSPQAVPGVRLGPAGSPESYGAGVGNTLSRVGAAIYEQEVYQSDRTAVFEADRQAADLQTALEGKLATMQGKNALAAHDAIQKEWTEGVTKIGGTLSNDRQKGNFEVLRSRRMQQLNETTQRHTAQEYGKYQDEETVNTIHSAEDRIRSDPGNQDKWAMEASRALSALKIQAQRKGRVGTVTEDLLRNPEFRTSYELKGEPVPKVGDEFASETYAKQQLDVRSGLHASVLQGYIAQGDDILAADYFKAHEKDLNAETRNKFERVVKEGSTIGESRRIVKNIIETDGIFSVAAQKEARQKINLLDDPKLADMAMQRLEHEIAVQDQMHAKAYNETVEQATVSIQKMGPQYPDKTVEEIVGVLAWTDLKPVDQKNLSDHLAWTRTVGPRSQDALAWFDFRALSDAKLATMQKNDLLPYLNKFDKAHYDRAIEDWNGARERASGTKAPKYETLFNNHEMFKNAVERSGFFPLDKPKQKWSDEEKLIWGTMEDKAMSLIGTYPAGTSPDVIQKALKALVQKEIGRKYTVDPGFFRSNKDVPAAGIEPYVGTARSIRVPLAEIPKDRQDLLRGALRKLDIPITTQNIEELEAKTRLKARRITPKSKP